MYRTVHRCEGCNLHVALHQDRSDQGAPVEVLHRGMELRRPEFDAYVELAERYGTRGLWMDVGCGTGALLACVAERGFTPEGLEVTDAREGASLAAVPGARIHSRPLEELGLPDGTYDVISLINVFSHLPSPSLVLAEIRRVLKDGGLLILRTGEIRGGGPIARRGMVRTLGDENQWLGTGTLEAYGRRVGFQIEERSFTPYLEWVLSPERLRMPSASPRIRLAKGLLRSLPGRQLMLQALGPLTPMGSVRAVLRKV